MALISNLFIAFVAVSVLLSVQVQGDCDAVDKITQAVQQDRGAFSDFIHSVGCSIKNGAKAVGDTVKDGYNYVKEKISPTPTLEDRIKDIAN